ncbi:tetratricopeptide repeat protein [Anaerolineales bacterium HSG6]|nr:tetratricopeptide repeat protein [Anaerolineales bacterium HSG6]
MSKRSSRRKRRVQQKQKQARTTGAALVLEGKQAFKQADYKVAIEKWSQALYKKDRPPTLPNALAEAYFRRALSVESKTAVKDFNEAIKLNATEPCYRYHLGLFHHRAGNHSKAEAIYRELLSLDDPYTRAAVPLAQLLIAQKKSVTKDVVVKYLSDQDKLQLAAAEALIKKKATSTMTRLFDSSALDPFWRGLLAVALNKPDIAHKNLADAVEQVTPQVQAVAQYYLGVLAAKNNQIDVALAKWQEAKAKGLKSKHLQRNLSTISYQQAIREQQAGHIRKAVELVDQIQHAEDMGKDFAKFQQQIDWEMGYLAAQNKEWSEAVKRWEHVIEAGDKSRGLIFNLALAYQHSERYISSAERWRELLRRRPRKADHPDKLSDDQVAQIWGTIAENYSKGEEYDEAIKTYKNAVKWAPENIDLRLKLVEAYQTEGRWQAATNEINRVLERKPDHVPALIMLAESYADDWAFSQRGKDAWLRVLEIEPTNPIARQQLAHHYIRRGEMASRWGGIERAIAIFKEGLEHLPDNPQLLLAIGISYSYSKQFDETRHYFDLALATDPTNLNSLYAMCMIWSDLGSEADLKNVIDSIKSLPTNTPSQFFSEIIDVFLEKDMTDMAMDLLHVLEQNYADDEGAVIYLASTYSLDLNDSKKAIVLLKGLLEKNPNNGQAHVQLGVVYYRMGQTRIGKSHWNKAEKIARETNDGLLRFKVKSVRDELIHGKRTPQASFDMLRNMPPDVFEELIRTAPPEVAEMLQNMDPDMLVDMMMNMSDIDEDDFYV